jgi:hypothetical protein
MRVFTASFYFLFFSLTAWGQTGVIHDPNFGKPKRCAVCIRDVPETGYFRLVSAAAVPSSLRTPANIAR